MRLADGSAIEADAVLIAAGPDTAAELLDGAAGAAARGWADAATPVRAACLDVGLARLPRPRATFALGIDRPLYLSVHSAVADLAPAGGAMIHVLKYLPTGGGEAKADERELEGLLDLIQPGWREAVVEHRFLPSMLVTNDLPTAANGGLRGRPDVAVPHADGVYVAGDWVGPEGMLADASLASARRAAEAIVATAAARQGGRMRESGTTAGARAAPAPEEMDPSTDHAALFADERRFVWALCYRMTGSAADADDLVQETFLRAIERPPARTDKPWRPWLVRVAMNLARDVLRRRRRFAQRQPWLPSPIETGDESAPPAYELPPESGSPTEGRYELLESVSFAFLLALEALTPGQRAVLLLRDVFDYCVRETADALGMNEPAVKTTHHRARRAMAALRPRALRPDRARGRPAPATRCGAS